MHKQPPPSFKVDVSVNPQNPMVQAMLRYGKQCEQFIELAKAIKETMHPNNPTIRRVVVEFPRNGNAPKITMES